MNVSPFWVLTNHGPVVNRKREYWPIGAQCWWCSSPGGEDTGYRWSLSRPGWWGNVMRGQSTLGYSLPDLEIIRRMYKLDENITTEIIILPKFLHNLGNQILYILPDFPVYVRTSWVSKYFLRQRKSIPKMFFFLKDFPLVQPSIKGGRETNDRDERQNDFFRSISSSMLSKFL